MVRGIEACAFRTHHLHAEFAKGALEELLREHHAFLQGFDIGRGSRGVIAEIKTVLYRHKRLDQAFDAKFMRALDISLRAFPNIIEFGAGP